MSRPDTYIEKLNILKSRLRINVNRIQKDLILANDIELDPNYDEFATNKEKQAAHQLQIEYDHTIDQLEKIEWE
jgi:hypothetical protein